MQKRVLMVGAGNCQLHMIRRLKERGCYTIAADYNAWTPAKDIADVSVVADAFDADAIEAVARQYEVDAVLTAGTDQPVLTVALVCARLGLPCDHSPELARSVTDKKVMKRRFLERRIPTVPYRAVDANADAAALEGLRPPYVLKPVDSQGQRGIFLVDTPEEAIRALPETLQHSRSSFALVEEYWESTEITVTGWVSAGAVRILAITDRVTFPARERLGVCLSHEYPSMHLRSEQGTAFEAKVVTLTEQICTAFSIVEGPIYFQFLVRGMELRVNEIACRIGGAYEDVTIPLVTGFSLLDAVIDRALGLPVALPPAPDQGRFYSTQLFFCSPGIVTETQIPPIALHAAIHLKPGDRSLPVRSASERAGYFIVVGNSQQEVEDKIDVAFRQLRVAEGKKNLVQVPDRTALLALALSPKRHDKS
ncbi:MAG: carboxylate--amine ligase [Bacillota bacterium]|nr:carboxylate--amine ligase [Bacillota bacterium]